MKSSAPRILFIDIETAPAIIAAWQLYDTNAVWVERDTHLLSFAAMWQGEKKPTVYALPDYPRQYKSNPYDDSALLRDLHILLSEADAIVAHNGRAFDAKKILARLAIHRFPPLPDIKVIDTLTLARRRFKFDSNKLDNLARYAGVKGKIPHTGKDLWRGCIAGDKKSWDTMRKYNAHDVVILEQVFDWIKGWGGVPDLRPYADVDGCPTCLSPNIQRRGTAVSRTRKYDRLHCQDCGHWFQGQRC